MSESEDLKIVTAFDDNKRMLVTTALMPTQEKGWMYKTIVWGRLHMRPTYESNYTSDQVSAILDHLSQVRKIRHASFDK